MLAMLRFLSVVVICCAVVVVFVDTTNSTLSKRVTKKDKIAPRPPGVAYNNRKYPTKCHVCRLMVEEISKSMNGKDKAKELTEAQIKEKKRKDRRKSKAEKRREKSMPILVAIEDVCNTMLSYIPQEEDRKKFRYIKSSVLSETKSLITSQQKSESESEAVTEDFNKFKHPETNRLMEMCDEILNKRENELLHWSAMEEKEDLADYFCRKRVLIEGDPVSDACFTQPTVKDQLWTNAFDAIFEKHPELRHQEF